MSAYELPLHPDVIKAFVIAGHGDMGKIQSLLAEYPAVLNVAHPWSETDHETALGAAAHVGNREIAEYLLEQGAPLDICTAAMLGRRKAVARMLKKDESAAGAPGAHGYSLMFHAAFSGDTKLTQLVLDHGGQTDSSALFAAIYAGHSDMAAWLLAHGADDLTVTDFRGRTPLAVAEELGHDAIAAQLRAQAAVSR